MSIKEKINKNVVHTHNGILFNHKEKRNLDESKWNWKYCINQCNQDQERQISYFPTYVWIIAPNC